MSNRLLSTSSIPRWVGSDLVPSLHLQNFALTETPNVVIIGDSTAGDGIMNDIGSATGLGYFWTAFQRKIVKDNPSKTITFNNYAIGGTNWGTINGDNLPTSFPSWWTNHANSWLSYVQALQPDTLIIMTGINGAYNTAYETISSVLSTVAGWAKVPDILFVTNKNPSPNAG